MDKIKTLIKHFIKYMLMSFLAVNLILLTGCSSFCWFVCPTGKTYTVQIEDKDGYMNTVYYQYIYDSDFNQSTKDNASIWAQSYSPAYFISENVITLFSYTASEEPPIVISGDVIIP